MSTVRKVTNRRESGAVATVDSQVREGLPEQLTFWSRDLKEGASQENDQADAGPPILVVNFPLRSSAPGSSSQ